MFIGNETNDKSNKNIVKLPLISIRGHRDQNF